MAPSLPSLRAVVAISLATLFTPSLVSAHTVITYPGWRGDNLHTNGSVVDSQGLGVGDNNSYPYGMQWMYPCGGMPFSANRTLWPLTGGALAVQPGWFQGHATAFMYVNLGDGSAPQNYSLPMVPVFQITGPTRQPYPGTICLPQVPLPANYTAVLGGNATIQVVETAVHGAALYNCVDITFADPKDVPEVNASNCFNSSSIGFNLVFATSSLSGADAVFSTRATWLAVLPAAVALVWGLL